MKKVKWYAPSTVMVGITLKFNNLVISTNKHDFDNPVEVKIINEDLIGFNQYNMSVTNHDNIVVIGDNL